MQRLFDFGHGDDPRRLARRGIDHQRQAGVGQVQLAGQCRLGHAGHTDDIVAVPLQPSDFRHRFQARPLGAGVDPMAAVPEPQRTQRLNQALAQRLVIGVAEVDMGDMLDIAGEIGVLASGAVVDQLVRHAQVPRSHRRMDATHRVHRDHRLGTRLLQRPEIGPVVHLVRREAVRMTVTCQEQHLAPGVAATLERRGRRAIRRFDRQGLAQGQPIQLGQAGSSDNRVDTHRQLPQSISCAARNADSASSQRGCWR